MRVVQFNNDSAGAARWDDFVGHCWNANFLHSRKFLSYHGARFDDRSVFIEDESGKLLGLFPAAVQPDEESAICSHPGATYGGIVHAGGLCGNAMKDAVDVLCAHYADAGFQKIIYKPPPSIFHARAVADDLWTLLHAGAKLTKRDLGAAVELARRGKVSRGRRRACAAGSKIKVAQVAAEDENIRQIGEVIADVLKARHNAKPTHSPEELILLSRLLGDAVEFWRGEKDGEMLCCGVTFVFARAVHAQYLFSLPRGFAENALSAMTETLIKNAQERNFAYFSFGTSHAPPPAVSGENLSNEARLNDKLHQFKISFGSGNFAFDRYELPLKI